MSLAVEPRCAAKVSRALIVSEKRLKCEIYRDHPWRSLKGITILPVAQTRHIGDIADDISSRPSPAIAS
jgi:hypothetical protein